MDGATPATIPTSTTLWPTSMPDCTGCWALLLGSWLTWATHLHLQCLMVHLALQCLMAHLPLPAEDEFLLVVQKAADLGLQHSAKNFNRLHKRVPPSAVTLSLKTRSFWPPPLTILCFITSTTDSILVLERPKVSQSLWIYSSLPTQPLLHDVALYEAVDIGEHTLIYLFSSFLLFFYPFPPRRDY